MDEPDHGAFLNALYFGEATLTFPQTIVLRYTRLEPPERRMPQAVEDYGKWFRGRLRGVDAVVSSRPYMCADRFTAADISVGYALMLAGSLSLDGHFSDAVEKYWERLRSREGFKRAVAAQERAAREQGVAEAGAP